MNEINEQLKGISELITRIDAKVLDINIKLNELIKALHEYDDEDYNEPNDALKEAISAYNETVANKRMDVIGQNGNTGEHYDEDSDKWSNKWELGGEG
jgi:peptidoglycan hydrolase CwlO-like protein